jgi:hypothetical protein
MATIIDTPTSPTPDGKITAAKIRRKYDDGTRNIRNEQLIYQENAAYVEGEQWVYRHNTRQEILQLPRNPRKVRVTIPRLGPESRRIFSKLLKRPLVFEVTPDAPDDLTTRGAAMAQGVITSLAREQKWERLREELAWTTWKGGTGILCLDWDTTAGRYLGESYDGGDLNEGDVRVTCLSISEVATEPGTRDIERACWWIKAQVLPPDEVKKQYGLKKTPPSDSTSALSPMQNRLAKQGNGQAPLNLTLVLTYYERPNADNREGTVATIVGNEIVDGPHPWPFPFKDRLNVVCARETIIEGRWAGRTVVTDAVPVQTALNHSWTSILEHLKQAGNARIQNNSSERINAENWSDEAAEFIFHDGDQGWSWLSPPPMPDWWQRTPQELSRAMDDIIGIHDVSRGTSPANVESGLGLSILAEQDETPTGKLAQTIAESFSDIATMILQTYEMKVPVEEQRTARIDQPGYIAEKFKWNGQSFAGQTQARVPYDAVAPMNEAARFARGMAFLDRKIIQTPRQLSAYVDIPGNSSFIEAIDPNVSKARRENYQMGLGEPMVPATFDNHQVHIEEHNAFRLSARYERLDQQMRDLIDKHVQAHSNLAAEEAAKQQARTEMAPMLAQAANADQMPGTGTLGMEGGMPQDIQSQQVTMGEEMGGMSEPAPEASLGGMEPGGAMTAGPDMMGGMIGPEGA